MRVGTNQGAACGSEGRSPGGFFFRRLQKAGSTAMDKQGRPACERYLVRAPVLQVRLEDGLRLHTRRHLVCVGLLSFRTTTARVDSLVTAGSAGGSGQLASWWSGGCGTPVACGCWAHGACGVDVDAHVGCCGRWWIRMSTSVCVCVCVQRGGQAGNMAAEDGAANVFVCMCVARGESRPLTLSLRPPWWWLYCRSVCPSLLGLAASGGSPPPTDVPGN